MGSGLRWPFGNHAQGVHDKSIFVGPENHIFHLYVLVRRWATRVFPLGSGGDPN